MILGNCDLSTVLLLVFRHFTLISMFRHVMFVLTVASVGGLKPLLATSLFGE